MVAVLALLFTNPQLSMADACSAVGVDFDSFRYWQRTNPEFIAQVRTLLGEFQKEQLLELELAWSAGLGRLMTALRNPELSPLSVLEIHKYLSVIREDMLEAHHATPGIEDEAQEFLKRGLQQKPGQSRFASLEVVQTPQGVRVDLLRDSEIEDTDPG